MRILVVGHTVPWPETTGARIRLAHILRGLARLGAVDLFVVSDRARPLPDPLPADPPVRRAAVAVTTVRASPLRRLRWLVDGDRPWTLHARDYAGVRAQFGRWRREDYDLMWLSRVEGALVVQPLVRAPSILDLDDLEDEKLRASRQLDGRRVTPGIWRRLADARDVRLWQAVQQRVGNSVTAVAVCSEEDRMRLALPNAAVIPNGYPAPAVPAGRAAPGDPPVITFPGSHLYPPNRDAAHYLVERIAPLLRARLPTAQIRIVGEADQGVRRLHRPPAVVVTGFVPDITTELARADLIAVPVRYGGGTRIKILEAFAHRIPVVSTPAGAAGLGAADGRELLLAGSPEAFADACTRVLREEGLRQRLVEAGQRLFRARYRAEEVQRQVAVLGATVAARAPSP